MPVDQLSQHQQHAIFTGGKASARSGITSNADTVALGNAIPTFTGTTQHQTLGAAAVEALDAEASYESMWRNFDQQMREHNDREAAERATLLPEGDSWEESARMPTSARDRKLRSGDKSSSSKDPPPGTDAKKPGAADESAISDDLNFMLQRLGAWCGVVGAKTQRLVDESAEKSLYAHFFFKTQKGNMMLGVL